MTRGAAAASQPALGMSGDGITYVGHATTVIELGGTRLLTDPVLCDRLAHIRRIAAPPPPIEQIRPDAVLISHAHHDHLEIATLRRLPSAVTVIAPPGCAALIRRRTGRQVLELAPGESARIGAATVTATDARHDGRRVPVGRPLTAVGYIAAGDVHTVYFAGDTDLFAGMRSLGAALDVALLPVWGWGTRVGPGHLDPARAAEAAARLRPTLAVPIHWGTLASPGARRRADPSRPAREFERLAAERAPGVEVRIVAVGERVVLVAA